MTETRRRALRQRDEIDYRAINTGGKLSRTPMMSGLTSVNTATAMRLSKENDNESIYLGSPFSTRKKRTSPKKKKVESEAEEEGTEIFMETSPRKPINRVSEIPDEDIEQIEVVEETEFVPEEGILQRWWDWAVETRVVQKLKPMIVFPLAAFQLFLWLIYTPTASAFRKMSKLMRKNKVLSAAIVLVATLGLMSYFGPENRVKQVSRDILAVVYRPLTLKRVHPGQKSHTGPTAQSGASAGFDHGSLMKEYDKKIESLTTDLKKVKKQLELAQFASKMAAPEKEGGSDGSNAAQREDLIHHKELLNKLQSMDQSIEDLREKLEQQGVSLKRENQEKLSEMIADVSELKRLTEQNNKGILYLNKAVTTLGDLNDQKNLTERMTKIFKLLLEEAMEDPLYYKEVDLKISDVVDSLHSYVRDKTVGIAGEVQEMKKTIEKELNNKKTPEIDMEKIRGLVAEMVGSLKKEMTEQIQKASTDKNLAQKVESMVTQIEKDTKAREKQVERLERNLEQRIKGLETGVRDMLWKAGLDPEPRPDFAIASGGARIIHSLTSPTYHTSGVLAKTIGKPPVTALQPSMNLGECWAMHGSRGRLGIQLSRQIVPQALEIDHVSKDVVYAGNLGLSTALKTFAFYAVFDRSIPSLQLTENDREWGASTQKTLLLAKGSFEPHKQERQVFNVRSFALEVLKKWNLSVRDVLLEISDNWGNKDWTCVYRVRVFGQLAQSGDD